jgi:L-rhamnose mutarotase
MPELIRKAFTMSVVGGPRNYLVYENRHNPIPPELARVLKDHGVSTYSIFLDHNSGQLFGYVEIESEEQWEAIADTDVCKRWWAHMADIMPTNLVDNSPISVELCEVFHLE